MITKQFKKEDYKIYLDSKSNEFQSLVAEVLDNPSYWTVERFVRRYGLLPKTHSDRPEGSKNINRSPSRAKDEWKMLVRHGLVDD